MAFGPVVPVKPSLLAVACVALLLAFGAGAGAHSVNVAQTGGGPSAVQVDGVGVFAVHACQDAEPRLPLLCPTHGVGLVLDVRGLESGDHHAFAQGTCQVRPTATFPFFGGDYFFLCGTDRDDDGLITNAPVCDGEDDTTPHGLTNHWGTNHDECTGEMACWPDCGAGEEWADDWVRGCVGYVLGEDCHDGDTRSFCFQTDVGGFTAATGDDTGRAGDDVSASSQAGGDWDEVLVFFGVPADTRALDTQFFQVEAKVSAFGATGCGGLPVSGHSSLGNDQVGYGPGAPGRAYCDGMGCPGVGLLPRWPEPPVEP